MGWHGDRMADLAQERAGGETTPPRVVLVLAGICCFCVAVRAGETEDRLGQCARVCGKLTTGADVTLRRTGNAWWVVRVGLHRRASDRDLAEMARLTDLEELQITVQLPSMLDGRISAEGLKKLLPLRKLRRLGVRGMAVSPDLLASAAKLSSVEALDLEDCTGVAGGALACLEGMPKLQRLSLDSVGGVTDSSMVHIAALRGLEYLGLRGTRVTDAGLKHLTGLARLIDLDLRGTRVTGIGVGVLRALPRLGRLHFGTTDGEWSLSENTDLSGLKALEDLRIETCVAGRMDAIRLPQRLWRLSAPDGLIAEFCRRPSLKRLTHVQIDGPTFRHGDPDGRPGRFDVLGALKALPHLRWLGGARGIPLGELKSVREVVSCGPLEALKSRRGATVCGQLQSLEIRPVSWLGYVRLFGDDDITLLSAFRGLRRLTLIGIGNVTSDGLGSIWALKNLRELTLGFARHKGRATPCDELLSGMGALRNLTKLCLSGPIHITDKGLKHVGELKRLRHLDLTWCRGYTDEGLASLMEALPDLQVVKRTYHNPPRQAASSSARLDTGEPASAPK